MYPDFLTCGKCADEFPLAKIDDFIIHKTSCLQSVWGGDTATYTLTPSSSTLLTVSSQAMLSCFLCHQEFHTARGVLHHIKHIHQMDTTQQKTPLSNHPFLSLDKQSIPLSSVAVNHSRTEKRTELDVLTTVASPKTIATVTQVPNTLELPVTCTKYTTTEGLINNYSGKNCQVTIQPPSTIPPPKKCCSSVVPKKRTRHMQEHDCDDMEQSALETLASFRGYLLKQKIKAHQQKSSCLLSRCPHKCKSKCVREVWHSENRCGSQDKKAKKDCSKDDLNREKENQICHYEPEPDCKTQLMTVETETCNSEEQHTANTKTRIRNSDVNLTIQPTETERAMVRCEDQIPAVAKELNSQWQMLSGLDGSSEQILTGWMYHAELPCFDQTVSVETASNSLSFLADACMMSPLRESSEPDSILDKGKTQRGCKKRHYPTSRPHKCSQCDQAFNQPIHLKKHMSKHTGVKPYKCEQCDYSTVERSHLKAHNRIHTGEKPFQCRFCTYATAQNSTLKVHLKRHHKDKRLVSLETTLSTNH